MRILYTVCHKLKVYIPVFLLAIILVNFSFLRNDIPQTVYAAGSDTTGPTMSLSPTSGFTGVEVEFWLNIVINTNGNESLSSRAVVTYDPLYLELIEVESSDMYCDYPQTTPEYGNSNQDGYVVITGSCADPISTEGNERFATLHFKAIKEGDTEVSFRYNGEDEPGYSVVFGESSPPTNIMEEEPIGGSYKIVEDLDAWRLDSPETSKGFNTRYLYILLGALGFTIVVLSVRKAIKTSTKKA
jgi:hypothetical protein